MVVDEVERLLHRAVDEPDVLAQARVQAVAALAQDRLGHATHRIQRRAQLVGQRPEEARVARRALAQLLRLLSELGQQGGDGAVGVDELAVEPDELALALAQRRERAHELGVLHAQLVERGLGLARLVALERAHDVRELFEARKPGVLLERAGQPHEHGPGGVARLDAIDELAQLREVEAVERLARGLSRQHALGDAADGDHGGRRIVPDGELDLALRAVAQRQAGDLPHRRRQAALRLGAELQEAGQVSCAAPREEYVLLRAKRKRDDRPPHPNRM